MLLPALIAVLPPACAGAGGPGASGATAARGPRAGGEKLLVRLYDARHELRFELANESHPDLAGVYSEPRTEASLKLAPDTLMAELLEDLGQEGFERLASDGTPPAAPPGRGWVEVRTGDRSRSFVVPPDTAASPEQVNAFVHMKLIISEYWSHLGALQYIENPQGKSIFPRKGT